MTTFSIIIFGLTIFASVLIFCGNRVLIERIAVINLLEDLHEIDKEGFLRSAKMLEAHTIRMHFFAFIRGKYNRKSFYGIE